MILGRDGGERIFEAYRLSVEIRAFREQVAGFSGAEITQTINKFAGTPSTHLLGGESGVEVREVGKLRAQFASASG
jgi:hypothetical protein